MGQEDDRVDEEVMLSIIAAVILNGSKEKARENGLVTTEAEEAFWDRMEAEQKRLKAKGQTLELPPTNW